MIFKIVKRSMLKKWGLFFAMFILILLSTLFIGLRHFTYDRMEESFATMTENSNSEDFRLYTNSFLTEDYPNALKENIENTQGVKLERQEQKKYKSQKSDETVYQLKPYRVEQEFNQILLETGELPVKENQVVVQPQYLEVTNQKIGDFLKISDQKYQISGTAYFIEEVFPIDIEEQMVVPDFEKYAPVYMNGKSFSKINAGDEITSSFYYSGQFKEEFTQVEQNEIYEKIQKEYKKVVPRFDSTGKPQISSTGKILTKEVNLFPYILDYNKNLTMSSVDQEVQKSKTMFNFLSIILTILTIFLAIVLVNSIFKGQRREMGILKAEGVSLFKLSIAFTTFIGIVVLVAGGLGLLLALPSSIAMGKMYNEMFQIYQYPLSLEIYLITIGTVAVEIVAILVLVYFFSIQRNLHQPTLNLIKNVDKEKVPSLRLDKYFKKLGFKMRYQLNIIIRNFSKTIFLFFGILFSSFLLMLGITMYTAITSMTDNTYSKTYTYDYVVNYAKSDVIKQNKNSFIQSNAELISYENQEGLQKLDIEEPIVIQTYDMDNAEFVHLTNSKAEKINQKNGIIATEGFLTNYDLEIGNVITVINPYDVEEEITMEIVDSTEDFFLPYIYANTDYLQAKFGTSDSFVNSEYYEGELTSEKKAAIYDVDSNASVSKTQDMEAMMGEQMKIITTVITIIAIFSSVIAFITLYSISSVIIDSNRKTISVMKVLGYSNREIKNMTIGIYKWFVIFIYLALLPILNFVIQLAVNQALSDAGFTLDVHLDQVMSLLGLGLILIIYLFSSNLTYRKIKKIKLAESLKADE